MSEHTPGPWRILYGHTDTLPIANDAGLVLANVEMPIMSTPAEWMANAELIAAAPETVAQRDELLAALLGLAKSGMCFCAHGIGNPMVSSCSRACKAAQAAIARARGGT